VPNAIGIWRIAPSGRLSTGRAGIVAVQANGILYVIGGNDAAGQYYSAASSAKFDAGQPW
jgi:N-acetylneuraminic acid mutarotase